MATPGDHTRSSDADGGSDPTTTVDRGARAPRRPVVAAVTVGGGIAATALGTLVGLWFMPFLVGAVVGATSRFPRKAPRTSRGYLTASVAAVLGWALPLAVQALGGAPVAEVARTTAALAGLPPLAGIVLTITLLIALIQALLGVWVGRTLAAPTGQPPAAP
ncbi:hypothetical protein JJV70_01215 [Streptomyces sp. JJ66]|uniref:hypothetical protein n=1 Tax=Streptomyces sp. JJ66 TaxID=2803843 RepID=UPI001C59A344|nr:hypothetical protein [Streptomyces sp. JJ66]MBW1600750.1 hypothetical protein [Streptomyces sp. JJ66]